MNTKINRSPRLKALSPAKQAKLERFWNERNEDPLAFVPKENKERGLDPTEARKVNTILGKSADSYVKMVIARITRKPDIVRRRIGNKKILAVGYGKRGYGSKWLLQATKAGYETWWIDVSSVAWMWASTGMDNQFQLIPPAPIPLLYPKPQVKTAEIQTLLAEPEHAELDLDSVEIWYLCRLLNCLSTRSAKIVLQEIGRTVLAPRNNSSRRGAVIIINALSDENPTGDACGGTSIRRSKRMILANLRLGAGCPVEPRFVRQYQYFDKLVTAMTVMIK